MLSKQSYFYHSVVVLPSSPAAKGSRVLLKYLHWTVTFCITGGYTDTQQNQETL